MIYKNIVERGVFFMTVSQRILETMENKHIKQKTLADYTGISTSAISDWKKKGTNPSVDKIVAISECLGVSVDYLLGRVDEPTATIKTVQGYVPPKILEEQNNLDELSKELLKTFKKLSFKDKISVLNYALNIESPPTQIVQTKAPIPEPEVKYARSDNLAEMTHRKLTKEQWDTLENGEDVDLN